MKVWIKVLLDFLHFAKDFAQNHAKENGTVQKYTTKFFSQSRNYCYGRFGAEIKHLYTQKKLANLNLVNHLNELMSRVLTQCRQGHPSSD